MPHSCNCVALFLPIPGTSRMFLPSKKSDNSSGRIRKIPIGLFISLAIFARILFDAMPNEALKPIFPSTSFCKSLHNATALSQSELTNSVMSK